MTRQIFVRTRLASSSLVLAKARYDLNERCYQENLQKRPNTVHRKCEAASAVKADAKLVYL